MKEISNVRTRIAPSPTGDPHVGTAYVALFNYAFAKSHGGEFILRIEDTDQKRSNKKSEDDILSSLRWLGITWNEGPDIGGEYGPYRQSDRLMIYKRYVDLMLEKKAAYKCICTPERLVKLRQKQQALKQPSGYDGQCRNQDPNDIEDAIKNGASYVVRLKTPSSGSLSIQDLRRGEITISYTEVDDQVLLKSDGFPTYHLANVVDDHLMGITHVIRGEEWISSLPKHVLIYDALGLKKPKFCHLPLLRNPDKSKVSKRKNPVSLNYFKQAGYLPEAMCNFLGLMAYSMEDGNEFFNLKEFISSFNLNRLSLGGPVFDMKKLLWLNGRYLRESYGDEKIVEYIKENLFNDEYLLNIIPLVKERVEKSEDFIDAADLFFKGDVSVSNENYLIADNDAKKSREIIEELVEELETLSSFEVETLSSILKNYCQKKNLKPKHLFMPLRMMVCGKKASPPLFETMAVLGKERCRYRIRTAINALRKN